MTRRDHSNTVQGLAAQGKTGEVTPDGLQNNWSAPKVIRVTLMHAAGGPAIGPTPHNGGPSDATKPHFQGRSQTVALGPFVNT